MAINYQYQNEQIQGQNKGFKHIIFKSMTKNPIGMGFCRLKQFIQQIRH